MNKFLPLSVALLVGLATAEIDQEYINDKVEELAGKTCYIYGDFYVFDLRSLAARVNDQSDYTATTSLGPLTFNYC